MINDRKTKEFCKRLFNELIQNYSSNLFGNESYKITDEFTIEYRKRTKLGFVHFYTREMNVKEIADNLVKLQEFEILTYYDWLDKEQLLRGMLMAFALHTLNPEEKLDLRPEYKGNAKAVLDASNNPFFGESVFDELNRIKPPRRSEIIPTPTSCSVRNLKRSLTRIPTINLKQKSFI